MKVMVSACLLGRDCKYNGGNNFSTKLAEYLKDKEVVEICPEVLAGFPTPRPRIERVNGHVFNEFGEDVHGICLAGVKKAVATAKEQKVDLAVLQSRSPSCGVDAIYDGTFSKNIVEGDGVFVKLLKEHGIRMMDVARIEEVSYLSIE